MTVNDATWKLINGDTWHHTKSDTWRDFIGYHMGDSYWQIVGLPSDDMWKNLVG